ncbi:tyrosine-type recombinase/integrase [Micromonospora chokoriensis]|uniref:tyrosine-type recombinase/integrase n=1 Tax=Micromonospora chokoriensis TaxID=356851 RepID=UPI000A9C3232|nr:tyrosine-type recombinase/integrase [Micromonospora chokoriensis]
MARRRYPPIKLGKDELYHAWVVVGTKGNGRPDQRHVKRRTIEEVEERVDELLDQKRSGTVARPGRGPTVRTWLLDTYLGTIAPGRIDPTTIQGYRSKLDNHVFPVIGSLRMDRVISDNIDAVYTAMRRKQLADATVVQVHRILARAWKVAARRRVVPHNIMLDVDPPTAKRKEMEPLTEDDALAVLAAARRRRNAARWSVGLAIGTRQGEALGLRWPYLLVVCDDCGATVKVVDWWEQKLQRCRGCDSADIGVVARIWWQLHRRSHEHGCADRPPWTCGRKRGGNCTARRLPLRSGEIHVGGGLILKEPKGKSKRSSPIPVELVAELRAHHEVQALEKMMADGAYANHEFVFADQLGEPIDPGRDWREWKAVLAAAGVRDFRVHDTRHAAATLLLAQGVDVRVVQELLGHSTVKVTEGYAHVVSKLARDATERMGRRLLQPPGTP